MLAADFEYSAAEVAVCNAFVHCMAAWQPMVSTARVPTASEATTAQLALDTLLACCDAAAAEWDFGTQSGALRAYHHLCLLVDCRQPRVASVVWLLRTVEPFAAHIYTVAGRFVGPFTLHATEQHAMSTARIGDPRDSRVCLDACLLITLLRGASWASRRAEVCARWAATQQAPGVSYGSFSALPIMRALFGESPELVAVPTGGLGSPGGPGGQTLLWQAFTWLVPETTTELVHGLTAVCGLAFDPDAQIVASRPAGALSSAALAVAITACHPPGLAQLLCALAAAGAVLHWDTPVAMQRCTFGGNPPGWEHSSDTCVRVQDLLLYVLRDVGADYFYSIKTAERQWLWAVSRAFGEGATRAAWLRAVVSPRAEDGSGSGSGTGAGAAIVARHPVRTRHSDDLERAPPDVDTRPSALLTAMLSDAVRIVLVDKKVSHHVMSEYALMVGSFL